MVWGWVASCHTWTKNYFRVPHLSLAPGQTWPYSLRNILFEPYVFPDCSIASRHLQRCPWNLWLDPLNYKWPWWCMLNVPASASTTVSQHQPNHFATSQDTRVESTHLPLTYLAHRAPSLTWLICGCSGLLTLSTSEELEDILPLWYSCLENPMDRGAWRAIVHGVTRNWTKLSD